MIIMMINNDNDIINDINNDKIIIRNDEMIMN